MNKTTLFVLILSAVLIGCKTKVLTPEQQAKADRYTEKIENREFTFHAMNASPQRGGSIPLTGTYYLEISGDTITAYLPYFGRSYIAPVNPRDIGVDFVSTKFSYDVNLKKNGVYEVTIVPQDLSKYELRGLTMFLSLSNSGYGSLRLSFTNRQMISYYGNIMD